MGRVWRRGWREPGGIDGLILLIEEHRAAFDYDWWTRFGKPVRAIGRSMTWGEAVRMVRLLRADPGSHIAAAVEDWAYPLSREAAILMDNWDALSHQVYKRPKPYPRPYPEAVSTERHGDAAGRTPDEVKALLRTRFGQSAGPV